MPTSLPIMVHQFLRLLLRGRFRWVCAVVLLIGLVMSVPLPAGEPKRLTDDGRYKQDPVFTPDGKQLVYVVQESPELMAIMRLDLASGKSERLHPDATAAEFEPAFSRDGRYYTFVQSRGNLSLKLVIRDTKTQRDATRKDAVFDPGGGFFGMHFPVITPDARRVLFSIPDKGGQQLVWVDIDGRNRQNLTSWSAVTNWPDISPDGKQVVFGSTREGDFEIYSMGVDGNGLRRLTDSPGRDVRPKWSPDGRRIAFASVRDGNFDVYVMQADGRQQTNLTRHAERDDYPVWHPDGKHLAVVSERGGKYDLYLWDVPD